MDKRSSLLEFLKKFFIWIQSHNKESDYKTAQAVLKTPVVTKEMPDHLERYMHYLMPELFQKLKEHVENNYLESEEEIDSQKSHVDFLKLKFGTTSNSCKCEFRKTTHLPCKHIFLVREQLGLPLFSKVLCDDR